MNGLQIFFKEKIRVLYDPATHVGEGLKLKQLIKGLEVGEVRGSKEVEITGISADSRTAAPGNLFLAKKGSAHD
jgi:hypothetical protein